MESKEEPVSFTWDIPATLKAAQGEVWGAFVTRACSTEKREVQQFGILNLKENARA